jgi:Iron permease FTR1 family
MFETFIQSAIILLREGLEAMLVLAALAAYLTKAGSKERQGALYIGAGLAVIASIVAAWLFQLFNNGVHSDIVEGFVILCAVALMLYVSGWLFIRRDPRAWQGYLATKADRALAQGTGIAIGLLAFFAVFREGAETVLFVYALAKTTGGWTSGLLAGLLTASLALDPVARSISGHKRRSRTAREKSGVAVTAGPASGVTTMVAHSSGPPPMPLGLSKDIYAGTTSLFFTVGNAIKAVPWLLLVKPMTVCLLAIPPGVWLGWRLHGTLDQRQIYRACYGLLVVTALKLL